MARLFVDTNIFLRHVLEDHADHSPRATAFLAQVDAGHYDAESSQVVVAEIVFTLERSYKTPKDDIRAFVTAILAIRNLTVPGRAELYQALDFYADYNVSFADAMNAVMAQEGGITSIVSFDRDFDRLPGITRIEP